MIIKIIRKEDDPICCRASIGGDHKTGFYLVYRNNPEDVLKAINEVRAFLITDMEEFKKLNINDSRTCQLQ